MSALPDWRVAAFATATGCLACILFALLPTLRLVRGKASRKARAHQFVVGAQVAASCVLLILASLLVRATLHTLYTDPGFGYEQVLAIDPASVATAIRPPLPGNISTPCRPAAQRLRHYLSIDRPVSATGQR